jgi:hypothetical protein
METGKPCHVLVLSHTTHCHPKIAMPARPNKNRNTDVNVFLTVGMVYHVTGKRKTSPPGITYLFSI